MQQMIKKLVASVLTLCMVLSLLPAAALAAPAGDKGSNSGMRIVTESYQNGILTVRVDGKVEDTFGIKQVCTMLSYDSSKLTLLSQKDNTPYVPTPKKTSKKLAVKRLLTDVLGDPFTLNNADLYGNEGQQASFYVSFSSPDGSEAVAPAWLPLFSVKFEVTGKPANAATVLNSTSLRLANKEADAEIIKGAFPANDNWCGRILTASNPSANYVTNPMPDNDRLTRDNHYNMTAEGNNTATYPGSDNAAAAAAEVEAMITALGDPEKITVEDAEAIQAAREAYEALSQDGKALVKNLEALEQAEARLKYLQDNAEQIAADKKAAAEVDALIEKIGPVTLESKADIQAARAAYEKLTPSQKVYVSKLPVLDLAEDRLAQLEKEDADQKAAAKVDALIEKIGTVTLNSETAINEARTAYNNLNADAQKLVKNLNTLKAAEAKLAELKKQDAADAKAAKAVDQKITAIGKVSLNSEAAIKEARQAYNELNANAKNKVTKLDVLTAAEAQLEKLQKQEAADVAAAKAVDQKIAAIGTVTLNSETVIKEARAAYNNLNKNAQSKVTKLDVLTAAEAQLEKLQKQEAADVAAAKAVDQKIAAIGTVTLSDEAAIKDARQAYNDLTPNAKSKVQNLKTLEQAEKTLVDLKDQKAANDVYAKIAAIGTVTLEDEAAIKDARASYNALTQTQKNKVQNLEVLENAEAKLAELKKQDAQDAKDAQNVDALIAKIGDVTLEDEAAIKEARTAYNNLNDNAKAKVQNLKTLEQAEKTLTDLKDQKAAAEVDAMIEKIGTVTLEDDAAIKAARKAYNALNDNAKDKVKNLKTLEKAEKALADLKGQDVVDQEAAAEVDAMIQKIGDVTLEDEAAIKAARAAYNDLNKNAKAKVQNLKTLEQAEKTLAELKDQKAAADVDALIAKIGEVTLEDEAAIQEARKAYNDLTPAQKKLVKNLDDLDYAEKVMAELNKPVSSTYSVTMNQDNKTQPSMCNPLFAAVADVTTTGNTATLKVYVFNPVPGFADQGADGTVKNVVVTYNGQTYQAESDLTTKPLKKAKATNSLFGLEQGKEYPTQVLTVKLPTAALSAEKLDVAAYVNVVMMTDVDFDMVLAPMNEKDTKAAEAVEAKIAKIGDVTLEDEAAINDARASYDALTDAQKSLVTNLDTLTAAEKTLAGLKDIEAAEAVDAKIAKIGTVTLASEAAIKDARASYDALNSNAKKLVKNLEVLEAAEKTLADLKGQDVVDQEAAAAVDAKIDAIGTVTLKSEAAIKEARDAYEALDANAKKKVTKLNTLKAAEKTLADLKADADQATKDQAAAEAVDEKIADIGKVSLNSEEKIQDARKAYEALTPAQKKLVTKLDTLKAAEKTLADLKDQKAANHVYDMIAAIGTVTLEDETAIQEARQAYNALTDTQKRKVQNIKVLEAAEKKLAELKDQAAKDKAAAAAVDAMIDSIGEVTLEDEATIKEARKSYEALTDTQKALVQNLNVLVFAENALADLQAQAQKLPFVDVKEKDWFYPSVQYVYNHGMMTGVSDTEFKPNNSTTRAQIVTILYRLEDEPEFEPCSFKDVAPNHWFYQEVSWASANGIVTGYPDGTFAPNKPISREQMAAILYRYAKYKGYDMTADADMSKFVDAGQINNYAAEPMRWAVSQGIMNGVGGNRIAPKGQATRAQIATLFMKFDQHFNSVDA